MPERASPAALHRQFVTVTGVFGTRQVHYRRGGQGPVVLLLHQSPQSSWEMEPLVEAWGHAFTLIAPDSPGYGFSAPLRREGRPGAKASIDDFASATLEFADALGIGRFGIYGYHTGASIGTALAAAAPDRITGVAANGFVVLTVDERAAILRDYLPPLVPCWDGGHLAWLWGRLREQTIFFPWHDRRAATRTSFPVPPANRLQQGLNEFLAAGEHYHVAYAAAFGDQAESRLPTLRVPLLITASSHDPLARHLDRIGDRSPSVQVVPSTDATTALHRAFAHLQQYPGDRAPTPDPGASTAPFFGSGYWGTPGRQVRIIRTAGRNPDRRRTVILLHAPGSSAAALEELADTVAGFADVLAVDLPGHGASDPPPATTEAGSALAGSIAVLAAALAPASGVSKLTLVAVGDSAPVALELAPRLVASADVILLEPTPWSATDRDDWLRVGLPALTPVWSGGHLLEAWHMVRDGRLFLPWFRREPAGVRPGEPDLDDARIQRDVRDVLRSNGAWQALLRDSLGYRRPAREPGGPDVTELKGPPASWKGLLSPS